MKTRGPRFWIALGLSGLIAVVLLGFGLNTLRGVTGHTVPRVDPADLSGLLAPGYRSLHPAGAGPFPTLILFSGCDGPKDNMDRWADMAVAEGWAAVIVDSHGPRGFSDWQIWRLICAGQLLTGQERAGDVAVALADVRAMPFVDPDRIVLLGASHGGWAVLDFLALHGEGDTPYSLTDWPASILTDGLAGLRGAILLYPYCGVLSRVRTAGWRHPAPVHFLLARGDGIVDERQCEDLARRMQVRGLPTSVTVFEGVTHAFDQEMKSPLSPLEFSPTATTEALELGRSLLAGAAGGTPAPGPLR